MSESKRTCKEVIDILTKNNIEVRPIVTGNFVKNTSVLKYFDYEVHDSLTNADWVDKNGFFVGNHQNSISDELELLGQCLN